MALKSPLFYTHFNKIKGKNQCGWKNFRMESINFLSDTKTLTLKN
nr:MAG TPA: hypothetical protein [Caudoviricetes sp.]